MTAGSRPRRGISDRPSNLRLLLVRHGQSEANHARRMQGQLDSPLTAKGRRQAQAMARHIAASGPLDGLYASPLKRALATAQAIAEQTGVQPVVLPDLMETDIGEAMGLTWDEFVWRWPEHAAHIRSGSPDARWPGGESRRELAERAARAMDVIVSRHPDGGVVAVVSHGGTLRWAVARLMAGTPLAHPDHRFDNCAITEVVLLGNGEKLIACTNDSSHLAELEEEEAHSDQVP
ncbi:MAG: histidine phosphatase family protein [Chloroflexota bacterium]|nr:histidine phosphatase family protein [Chloroflexota bacterium]